MTKGKVTVREVVATNRTLQVFGQAVVPGDSVTVYDVDGFSFPTKAAAEAFASSAYPRQLPDGRYVTDESPPRVFRSEERAKARQKAQGGQK